MPVDLLGGGAPWMGDCKWHLVPRPLGACGNKTTSLEAEAVTGLQATPLKGGIDILLGGEQTHRFIHPDELGVAAEILRWRDDPSAWETLSDARTHGVVVKRRAGESLAGPITCLVDAHLPGIPLECAADVISNFTERSQWDTQQVDFVCHDEWGSPPGFANGLFSFTLHVPPLVDRDFVNFHLMARRADGNGYITLTREAAHPSYPPKQNKVRGKLYANVLYANRDDKDPKSTRFCLIVKTDAKFGIVPFWLINIFIPGELVKWKKKLDKVCIAKLQAHRAGNVSFVMAAVLNPPDTCPEPEPCPEPVKLSSTTPWAEVEASYQLEPSANKGPVGKPDSGKAETAEVVVDAVASPFGGVSVDDGSSCAKPPLASSSSPVAEAWAISSESTRQEVESRGDYPLLPSKPACSSPHTRDGGGPAIDDDAGPKDHRSSSSCFSCLRCY